jgi:hypothetical protein
MERVRRSLCFAAVVVATVVAAAPAAVAHGGHPHDGLKRVRPDVGPPLLTHGGDPVPSPESERRMTRALPDGVGFYPGDAKRPPVCATDYYQHVIYARPSSAANRADESREPIRNAVKRTNAVLDAESKASGGGSADYKVLCNGSGEIEVGQFASSGNGFSQIVSAARSAGYDSSRADYLIFYDARTSGACGIASFAGDERLTIDNASNTGGDYAVVYENCWESHLPMHEGGHMMGAVQYNAPHSTGSGSHCNQENDVMCYSPDGGDRNQGGTVQNCGGESRFDCGFDDYFDAAPEPGEYLASHWNLGSRLNRFIAFGGADPGLLDTLGGAVQSLLGGGRKSGSGNGVAGGPGSWRMFKLEVTRPSSALRVKLRQPPNAPLTLYVRRMKAPTAQRFSCKERSARTTVTCKVRRPRQGRWYAGVASGGAAGTPFTIRAKLDPRRR